MNNTSLVRQQLEGKMSAYTSVRKITMPPAGWIKTIRQALGISARQLGNKLSVSRQAIMDMEKREAEGNITLKALQEVAVSMDMQLVYGFVPNAGSLDALINKRATELATQIVMRTSQSMRLENQENTEERLKKAIEERTNELKRDMPKSLWD